MKFPNCNLVSILIISILFFMLFYNTNFVGDHSYNNYSLNVLQNSYSIETTDDKVKDTRPNKR